MYLVKRANEKYYIVLFPNCHLSNFLYLNIHLQNFPCQIVTYQISLAKSSLTKMLLTVTFKIYLAKNPPIIISQNTEFALLKICLKHLKL